ncbi:MAG: hypothetical protein OXL34_16905 [Gemmatimonadota bacterium]|nr:hypothetical protein [Gemmatimonadota bacterium]
MRRTALVVLLLLSACDDHAVPEITGVWTSGWTRLTLTGHDDGRVTGIMTAVGGRVRGEVEGTYEYPEVVLVFPLTHAWPLEPDRVRFEGVMEPGGRSVGGTVTDLDLGDVSPYTIHKLGEKP